MIIFVWLVVLYYSFTSLIGLLNFNQYSIEAKTVYAFNMCLCIGAFLVSDLFFNKREKEQIQLDNFFNESRMIIIVVEAVYWISLVLTYIELRTQDYSTYVSEEGQAGWAQCFFQTTSCILVYFLYKKQWLKVITSTLLVVGMIATTGVRSLLYFVILPLLFFYINKYFFVEKKNAVKTFTVVFFLALFFVGSVFVVDTLRYGEVKLPEIELTRISLDVLDAGGYPHQYFNSLLHYVSGFASPFIGALNKMGADIPSLSLLLPPSIPKLNDLCIAKYNAGEAHMPASIFHDFYMSFGYYGALWGFVVFSYFKIMCDWFQKNAARFFAFAGIFGWHIFMILRGACDGASSGISYSILLSFILYLFLKRHTTVPLKMKMDKKRVRTRSNKLKVSDVR